MNILYLENIIGKMVYKIKTYLINNLEKQPMNEILQYNDDATNKLLEMYRTPDIQTQYREFLKYMKSDPGKRILA
jgi:hypothetical protein